MNKQEAPYPDALADLVSRVELEPGWRVKLEDIDRGQGSKGLTLAITCLVFDSYHPEQGRNYRVIHYFPVPPAAYNEISWRRWLFDRYQDVVSHEACEFFKIDGKRPYAPHHGPGNDPYIIFERGTDADARKRFNDFSTDEPESGDEE